MKQVQVKVISWLYRYGMTIHVEEVNQPEHQKSLSSFGIHCVKILDWFKITGRFSLTRTTLNYIKITLNIKYYVTLFMCIISAPKLPLEKWKFRRLDWIASSKQSIENQNWRQTIILFLRGIKIFPTWKSSNLHFLVQNI